MSKWTSRANALFSEKRPDATPITPNIDLSGVLGVAPPSIPENDDWVMGVLGVPTQYPSRNSKVSDAVLIGAAMAVCDFHGDGEQARQDMRKQVLETPAHLRADLLDHFRKAYGEAL